LRNFIRAFIVLIIVASVVSAKNKPEVQTIQLKSRETKVPLALLSSLLKQSITDGVQFADLKDRFSAHEIDLNEDGKSEIEITANGAAATSPMWIFSKQGKQFTQLLKADVGVYGYSTLKETNHNYHDILTIEHVSAAEHQITIYRFNGRKYKQLRTFMEKVDE
jgi:hypothetical protein